MSKPDTSRVDVASFSNAEDFTFCLACDQIVSFACNSSSCGFADSWKARALDAERTLTPPERAASPSGESGWRPIESAPKDGKPLLLCVEGFEPCMGKWLFNRWVSFNPEGVFETDREMWKYLDGTCFDPTHWRPAPPAPRVPAQAESGEVERPEHSPKMMARWLSARSAGEYEQGNSLDAYRFKQAALILRTLEDEIADLKGGQILNRNAIRLQSEARQAAEARCRQLEAEAAASRAEVERLEWLRGDLEKQNDQIKRAALTSDAVATASRAQVDALAGALGEVDGCFEAAFVEGLSDRLAEAEAASEPGSLTDLLVRRLLPAGNAALAALAAHRPGSATTDGGG